MKLLRVGAVGEELPAVLTGDGRLLDASSLGADYDPTFFASGGIARLATAVAAGQLSPLDAPAARIGAPVAAPQKVVCIGLNYHDHARETGAELPTEPVVFMKAPNTVVGPHDAVLIPRGSEKTDLEVELGVVVSLGC